jgi:endoglucanase
MEAAAEMGVGINLGNTFEAYWEDSANETSGAQTIGSNTPQDYETCWGAVVTTKEVIDGFRDAGFQTVRIPVYWGNMMEDDGTYTINEDYFQRIDEVVDWCIEDGLYTVINIHHYDEFLIKNHPKEEVLAATETLWTEIADHYKNYSNYLVFEGFNENLGSQREEDSYTEEELYQYVNEMNQTFVDAVRNTGGKNKERFLIASGYWTNIDMTTDEQFQMPTDSAENKLMVSVHYIDNAKYWTNQIGNEKWVEYSTEQCELLKEAFTDKNIPVFVGECTSIYDDERIIANAKYDNSTACLDKLLTMAAIDYGFVPVLWDVNDNFYSRTEYKIKSDFDAAIIAELAARLKDRYENS